MSVVVTGEHSPGPRSRLHRKEKVQGCSVGIKVSFKRLWKTHPIDNNQKSEQANLFSMHLHEALPYTQIKPKNCFTKFNLIPHNCYTVIRECNITRLPFSPSAKKVLNCVKPITWISKHDQFHFQI